MSKDIVILVPEQWRISLIKDKSLFLKWNSDLKELPHNISILDWQDSIKKNQKILALAFDFSIAEFILRFNNLENFFLLENFLNKKFSFDLSTIRMLNKAKRMIKYYIKPKKKFNQLPNNLIDYIQPGLTFIDKLDYK